MEAQNAPADAPNAASFLSDSGVTSPDVTGLVHLLNIPHSVPPTGASQDSLSQDSLSTDAHLRHQLRTPLNQIVGYAELLIEEHEEANDPRHLPELGRIQQAGHQLLDLINRYFTDKEQKGQHLSEGIPEAGASAKEASDSGKSLSSSAVLPHGLRQENPLPSCILVVDDEPGNRDLLTRRLEHDGHSVMTAKGGSEAFTLLGTHTFDLVLLDDLMPEMSGIEVLQQMRSDARWKHLPVIMLSALDDLSHVARCIELGAEDYLPKPFNPIILRARISASLEKKRLRDTEAKLFAQLQGSYDQLSALERWREEWTQMLVHDLRTPLTAILGSLQALALANTRTQGQTLNSIEDIRNDLVDISTHSAENMLSLVNDLLDTAQLEAGTFQPEFSVVEARDMVTTVVTQMQPLALHREVELKAVLPPTGDLRIRADMGRIARVLVNLVANALKFTPANGKVTVEVEPQGNRVRFAVHDTGEGIPTGALTLIFQKFGRVEAKNSGYQNGTGLGLTFCKMVVEAHGGTLGVKSTLNEGSTFFFDLPAA